MIQIFQAAKRWEISYRDLIIEDKSILIILLCYETLNFFTWALSCQLSFTARKKGEEVSPQFIFSLCCNVSIFL
jgi:hypothetical protein